MSVSVLNIVVDLVWRGLNRRGDEEMTGEARGEPGVKLSEAIEAVGEGERGALVRDLFAANAAGLEEEDGDLDLLFPTERYLRTGVGKRLTRVRADAGEFEEAGPTGKELGARRD